MKSPKELMDIAIQRHDWKHLKLWFWANQYEAKATEWNNLYPPVTDDRRVFIDTYKQVYDAIDSLSDNPNSLVCVAMNQSVRQEAERMDKILAFLQCETPRVKYDEQGNQIYWEDTEGFWAKYDPDGKVIERGQKTPEEIEEEVLQERNTLLYKKMFAEQEAYQHWLLMLPPEEILEKSYEYWIREDILLAMEYHGLTIDQANALLQSSKPLSDIVPIFEKMETNYMDTIFEAVESRAEALLRQGVDKTEEIEEADGEVLGMERNM